jgi:hypothetical protein
MKRYVLHSLALILALILRPLSLVLHVLLLGGVAVHPVRELAVLLVLLLAVR